MTSAKMMIGVAVVASVLLAGCSKSEPQIIISDTQLSQLISDVQIAKSEAARANQRLDNLTISYRK